MYEPSARAARDTILKERPDAEVVLVKSGGGVFEITVDGALRYSKKATGVFPTKEQVKACLA